MSYIPPYQRGQGDVFYSPLSKGAGGCLLFPLNKGGRGMSSIPPYQRGQGDVVGAIHELPLLHLNKTSPYPLF